LGVSSSLCPFLIVEGPLQIARTKKEEQNQIECKLRTFEYQTRKLNSSSSIARGLCALLVDAVVTVVGGVSRVDGAVVLDGPLLHSLYGLLEGGWGRLVGDGAFRCGGVVAGGRWLDWGELSLAVVGFPGSLDLSVVLLVFLGEGLKTVLHAPGGDDGAAVGVLSLNVAWDVGWGRHC
jgi:hypothetical protein